MDNKNPILTITIPVLNEEDSLVNKITTLQSYIDKYLLNKMTVEIVIADNGSSDKTSELGKMLASENENILFMRTKKKGVGLALKESWQRYKSDFMGYMDLDLSTDLSHIEEAIKIISTSEYEIVSGSRLMKESDVIGRTFLRSICSIIFNKLLRMLFKVRFSDGMCGFKFFQLDAMDKLNGPRAMHSNGWFFATEFLILSERANIKVKDLPIKWTNDPSSKVKIVRLAILYLFEMMALKRRLDSKK